MPLCAEAVKSGDEEDQQRQNTGLQFVDPEPNTHDKFSIVLSLTRSSANMLNIVAGLLGLAAVISGGVALFCIFSAIFSARAQHPPMKGIGISIIDLVPILLLTPFLYNRIGKSYYFRALFFGALAAVLVLITQYVSNPSAS